MASKQITDDRASLSEAELDVIRMNLVQQEQRLKDEKNALREQRTEFEREREAEIKRREKGDSASLAAMRADLNRQEQRIRDATAHLNKQRAEFDLEKGNASNSHTGNNFERAFDSLREEMRYEIDELKTRYRTERDEDRMPTSERDRRGREYYSQESELLEPATHAAMNPKVSFREATESIPNFDGYNVPLAQFVRACRRGRDIVPPSSERNLTKVIINKLRGRAYYAVEDEPCDTIAQLTDLLNEAFGPHKTLDQYRGDLSACYLTPGEHMLDYITRIKDLRTAVLDAERYERGSMHSSVTDDVDALTARSFCDGLPLAYRLQMRAEHYTCPFKAFSAAKTLAKREELDRQRNAKTVTFTPRPSAAKPAYNDTAYGKYPTDRGATRADWRARTPPHDARNDERYERYRAPQARANGNSVWCRYCKNQGHEIQDCRKKAYNDRESGNAAGPPTRSDPPREGPQRTSRPIRSIGAEREEEPAESERSE